MKNQQQKWRQDTQPTKQGVINPPSEGPIRDLPVTTKNQWLRYVLPSWIAQKPHPHKLSMYYVSPWLTYKSTCIAVHLSMGHHCAEDSMLHRIWDLTTGNQWLRYMVPEKSEGQKTLCTILWPRICWNWNLWKNTRQKLWNPWAMFGVGYLWADAAEAQLVWGPVRDEIWSSWLISW